MQYNIKKSTFLYIFIIFTCFYAQSVSAADKNTFSISGILVDETAENSEEARKRAISSGEIRAFNQLISSFVSSDNKKIPDFSKESIKKSVQGFEVEKEKISGTRYSSSLTFFFYRDIIKKMLSGEGIDIDKEKSHNILFIPLYFTDNEYFLLNPENTWEKSWNNISSNMLISVLLPLGDLIDMQNIKLEDVLSGNYISLKGAAERYKAKYIIIAEGIYKEDERSLEVILKPVGADNIPDTRANYKMLPGDARDNFFETSVKDILQRLENKWNYKELNPYNHVNLKIRFANIEEWQRIKKKINKIDVVKNVKEREIFYNNAVLDVYFEGNIPTLTEYIDKNGLMLLNEEGSWALELKR